MERALETVERLLQATNRHDLEALVGCFAEDFVNETPVHPARGFQGRDQVRRNWEQIFAGVPDLHATVTRSAVDGDLVWTEWEMVGLRRDGSPHRMIGVVVFEAREGLIRRAHFYLEPADSSTATVDDAVSAQLAPR